MGDNIDRDIKPRNMQHNRQTKSFNVYAVQDRIDTSHLHEVHKTPPMLHVNDFLPSSEDYTLLKNNFAVLVSRILCHRMDFFKQNFSDSFPTNTQFYV